jgi:XTP/dITP diphosphohydrolase
MHICFATRNLHKIAEVQALMPPLIQLIDLDTLGCKAELPETTDTIEGNSSQKAQFVWDHYQVAVFADDSGLEIEALAGRPGVHSAYYAGNRNPQANYEKVLQEMIGLTNRSAQFKTVITLLSPQHQPQQFVGIVEGQITTAPHGDNGFGYDPIFIPKGYSQTFAEMSLSQKNQLSHRAKAITQLVTFLESLPIAS